MDQRLLCLHFKTEDSHLEADKLGYVLKIKNLFINSNTGNLSTLKILFEKAGIKSLSTATLSCSKAYIYFEHDNMNNILR